MVTPARSPFPLLPVLTSKVCAPVAVEAMLGEPAQFDPEAIPAVIFYNMTVRKIDLVGNELDRLRTILEEAAGSHIVTGPAGRDFARRPDTHNSERI